MTKTTNVPSGKPDGKPPASPPLKAQNVAALSASWEKPAQLGAVTAADLNRYRTVAQLTSGSATDIASVLPASWLVALGRNIGGAAGSVLPLEAVDAIAASYGEAAVEHVKLRNHADVKVGTQLTQKSVLAKIEDIKDAKRGAGYRAVVTRSYLDGSGKPVAEIETVSMHFAPSQARPWPQPYINYDNMHFWKGVDEGKWLIQRCKSCGQLRHPAGPGCPNCTSIEWDTVASTGKGKVYSFTIHHARHADLPTPYAVVLVELDEGIRVVSNIIGIAPHDIKIGLPVELSFRPARGNERAIPQFYPAGLSKDALGGNVTSHPTPQRALDEATYTSLPFIEYTLSQEDLSRAAAIAGYPEPHKVGKGSTDSVVGLVMVEAYIAKHVPGARIKSLDATFAGPFVAGSVKIIGGRAKSQGSKQDITVEVWTGLTRAVSATVAVDAGAGQ